MAAEHIARVCRRHALRLAEVRQSGPGASAFVARPAAVHKNHKSVTRTPGRSDLPRELYLRQHRYLLRTADERLRQLAVPLRGVQIPEILG